MSCLFSSTYPNFFKYSFSNFLLFYLYNNFAIYLPGSSLLLNSSIFGSNSIFYILSIPSHHLTFVFILPSNSSTNFSIFSKFSFFFYISFSIVNFFYLTKYFSIPYIFILFNIFSTSYSSTLLTSTGFSSSTFYPLTCSLYLTTLLTFITR